VQSGWKYLKKVFPHSNLAQNLDLKGFLSVFSQIFDFSIFPPPLGPFGPSVVVGVGGLADAFE
jgi:hypothetical protein